jgi:MFS transporter, DHA3 family, macrolide efflux protein
MRIYLLLWFSQFVSGVGTGLGSFALGVWVYRQNASATQYSMMAFVATCTALLVGPLAGVLADRWDRKRLILLGDSGAAVMTSLMALALYTGQMRLWHVYIIVVFMVGFSALQGPALTASVSMLVSRRQLGRASGLAQAAGIATGLVCPPLSGALIPIIDYHGVIAIDISTFLFAFLVLLFIRLPRPESTANRERRSMVRDFLFGWTYIRQRPGLLSLLGLFAVTNFSVAIVQVLLTPLILSFGSATNLGTVQSAAAAGGLIGSLALGMWGGPRNRVAGILLCVLLRAPLLLLGALQPNVTLIAVAVFLYMGLSPFTGGLSQAIWQSKVAHDIQGRVFAMRGLIATSTAPLAFLLAGPLADHVFEPLLAVGGPLAATAIGRLIGVGPGRGVGLLFICLGLLILVVAGLSFLNPRLRRLESEIPDAIPPSSEAPAANLSEANQRNA